MSNLTEFQKLVTEELVGNNYVDNKILQRMEKFILDESNDLKERRKIVELYDEAITGPVTVAVESDEEVVLQFIKDLNS